ncbi:MAG: site-specific integrase [Terracidiphilus sp.]|jgi:integrase/recombinase XerC
MNTDANSIQTYIDGFSKGLKNAQTRRQYRQDLEVFAGWVARVKKSNAIEVVALLKPKDIKAYLQYRASCKAGHSVLRKARSATKAFYKHLGDQRLITDNPVDGLESMKQPVHLHRPPSVSDVNRTLDQVRDLHPFWPARDQAIFELCYEGLAEADLIALNVAEIDLAEGAVWRHSKRMMIPIGPMATQSLAIWVKERAARLRQNGLEPDCTPALFIGSSLQRLDDPKIQGRIEPRTVCHVIKRIRPGWSARLLRDACGVHMLDNEAPPISVAIQLGVEVGVVARLLKMATKRRGETVTKTHPRATVSAWDQVLEGEQIPLLGSSFDPA